jgi:hypothetical protein
MSTSVIEPDTSRQSTTSRVNFAGFSVVVTTGRAVSEADRSALGRHAVLPKPWRAEEAVEALRRVLPR